MAVTSNLLIEQGATFTITINYNDDLGNPNDLTSYTAQSKMRRSFYSSNATSLTASITNPANGEIVLSMTAANTANLRPGRYVYDLEVSNATQTLRVIEGIITVLPEVTR